MSSKPILQAIKRLLGDFPAFSRQVIKVPLYDYQLQVTQPIIDSIQSGAGDEYLLIFPRQSGKNEVTAQLLVYFLVLFQKKGGNIVFAATGDGAGRGARRLDDRLDNAWTRGKAKKQNHPARRTLQKASVVFLSAHPTQKPQALAEYLIRTYTNRGDLVLDPCMGSGTTGLAALATGRRFIGIEKGHGYAALAAARIAQAVTPAQPPLLAL